MPSRYTVTEKWADPWFRRLPPNAKLLFNYLCDICDIAGFYEIDSEMAGFQLGISPEVVEDLLSTLGDRVIIREGWLWIRNFIRHQRNETLNTTNSAHRGIIRRLEEQSVRFPEAQALLTAKDNEQQQELEPHTSPSEAPTEPLPSPLEAPAEPQASPTSNGKGNGSGTVLALSSTKDLGMNSLSAGAEAPAQKAEIPPPFITLPTNKQGVEYPVARSQIEEYVALYPNVDVEQALRSMRGWLLSNRTKRKTIRGMPSFITSWLSREQDRPRLPHTLNGNAHAHTGKRNFCPTADTDAELRHVLGLSSA